MPELPEVETVLRGILPSVSRRKIKSVRVSNPSLRLKIPPSFARTLTGRQVRNVTRRAKYLVFDLDEGDLLVHLGMSGTLRIAGPKDRPVKHDHVTISLSSGKKLVYNDPRRFGLVAWTEDASSHRLLACLGVEPLSGGFRGGTLHDIIRSHRVPIKNAIMNSRLIAGIGNIYANEALFAARIDPARPASGLDEAECARLASSIKKCLRTAIKAGGSTLKDFRDADSRPGYFQLSHNVYGRAGQKCKSCGNLIRLVRQSNRASYYCPACQA